MSAVLREREARAVMQSHIQEVLLVEFKGLHPSSGIFMSDIYIFFLFHLAFALEAYFRT